jgi:hypothetical protein
MLERGSHELGNADMAMRPVGQFREAGANGVVLGLGILCEETLLDKRREQAMKRAERHPRSIHKIRDADRAARRSDRVDKREGLVKNASAGNFRTLHVTLLQGASRKHGPQYRRAALLIQT